MSRRILTSVTLVLIIAGILVPQLHGASSAVPETPVDINTAGLNELCTLPYIGPAKAQAIIDYRESSGAFDSVEGIMNVKGIGEKTFLKIKDHITVGEVQKAE